MYSVYIYLFIISFISKPDINFKIVMFIWWQRIWSTDLLRLQQLQHRQQNQQISITNEPTRRQSHLANRRQSTHTSPQMPYSTIQNCSTRQSKCIRMSSTEQSSRMQSFCSVIILIHCFNVFVLAIASENSTTTQPQPQPCDRTRRVYTDVQGEISNGPFGSNYTQVSAFICPYFSFHFAFIICCCCCCWWCSVTLSVWACVFLVELISYSVWHFVHIFITKERWWTQTKKHRTKPL